MRRPTTIFTLALLLAALPQGPAKANGMHPQVPLLDAAGQPVIESGQPLSTMVTCGSGCHDTAFIMASSDHADAGASQISKSAGGQPWALGPGYYGGWNPLDYDLDGLEPGGMDLAAWLRRYGPRHVGGGPAAGLVEMDCLLCHTDIGDHSGRRAALRTGDFAWANSASLAATGVLSKTAGAWHWDPASFEADGALRAGLLEIRKPRDQNCGQCHGQVDDRLDPPLTISTDPARRHESGRTGQVISPQKLSDSGLNVAAKEALNHPFDVHTARVVGCVNCHYSLNDPVYFRQRQESRPPHLAFDPRRLTIADYLERPLHQFAKGKATLGLAAVQSEHSLRRCESCHDAERAHAWLPYRPRHFAALACEACHAPRLYGPALMAVDWTLLDSEGRPVRQYRSATGDPAAVDSLVEGFEPVLLPRANAEGEYQLAPFNLVTSWYWVGGDPPRPVSREVLESALVPGGRHHPALVAALDRDGDGALQPGELRLDDPASVATVARRLREAGVSEPRIASEVTPFSINHDMVGGRWALRDCGACHGEGSRLAAAFPLSAYQPGGQPPLLVSYPEVQLAGRVTSASPAAQFDPDPRSAGFHILGLDAQPWVDRLGLTLFLGVVLGVIGHAVARIVAARRRPAAARPYERVYMYQAYERLWHWLQASAILLLLFTGLVIHKPQYFGMFSFAHIVRVHNVLGFILLTNAALALFYNLASGEIRQYLPQPKGFIARSLAQAMYYSRGIFAGQPHPLEKTRGNKLNPLQQITYLIILNILLPAQVITGVLIWGLQRWPQIATSLGGFQVLATVHTLVAWSFAAFIVMHVYLTTAAGQTATAGIRAMIEGWDEVERHAGKPQGGST